MMDRRGSSISSGARTNRSSKKALTTSSKNRDLYEESKPDNNAQRVRRDSIKKW
jgi:hypothetical protein